MDRAAALAASHRGLAGTADGDLRAALVALHGLFSAAPQAIRTQYEQLHEATLQHMADAAADRLLAGDLSWRVAGDATERMWALTIGAQLRALDWLLLRAAHEAGTLDDPAGWLVDGVYIIPRLGRRTGRQGQGFDKRGLLNHRLLPQVVRGHEVHLIGNDMRPVDRNAPLMLGAALFRNPQLKTRPTVTGNDKAFVATDMVCADAPAHVAAHIEGALDAGCFAVVWPELSVTPDLRRHIQAAFAQRSPADARPAPEVVVAGSWHEPEDGRHVNRARILDGYGAELAVYDKVIPYIDKDLGPEDIRPGRRLPVVVTGGHLVGFAICKDFCDVADDSPFFSLHLDVVLVPSMGDEATMRGHQNTAKRAQATFGTRAFVVQQCDPAITKRYGCGMVLPALASPDSKTVSQLKQKPVWKAYPRRD